MYRRLWTFRDSYPHGTFVLYIHEHGKSPSHLRGHFLFDLYIRSSQHAVSIRGLKDIIGNKENKYANLDLSKVYEYADLPDKILSRPKLKKDR